MSMIAAVIGRLLLGAFFVISGFGKVVAPAGTAAYIESATTLPGSLAMPTGVFEIVAGLLLAIGLMTRLVSILLAGFTLLTIFFFHNQFGDPTQATQALKNMAITGGLLMTFAYGHMRGSYDHMRERRRTYDAELRAARAEGRAEMAGTTTAVDVDGDGVPDVRRKRRWL